MNRPSAPGPSATPPAQGPSITHGLDGQPSGLILAEQAIHLLRCCGGAALAEYYIGTLPFVLGLLFFWSDMSRNPFARWYCAPAAAGLALLFIWMKLWHVRFGRRIGSELQHEPRPKWTIGQWLAIAARQAGLQATGWLALPLAALIMLPLAWTYAFYQNLTVIDGPQWADTKALMAEAKRQATRSPMQNHVMLTVISLFGLVVLGNLAIFLILVPQLLQKLLGIETVFTLSGLHLLNTTFLAVVISLTYLCLDPVVKTAYVIRCYLGRSRHTGEDIRQGLKTHAAMIAAILAAVLIFEAAPLKAQQNPTGDDAATYPSTSPPYGPDIEEDQTTHAAPDPAYAGQLDAAIDKVLQQRRFAWRLAREKVEKPPETDTWQGKISKWIFGTLAGGGRTIGGWLKRFWEWLTKWLPKTERPVNENAGRWRGMVKTGVYVLVGVLFVTLLWWLRNRLIMRRRNRPSNLETAEIKPIDLADETITARDLPADEWLIMAAEMLAKEDLRQALRAFYLALLAVLADHGWVVIARHKTNQDYYLELTRRQRNAPELLSLFDLCRQAYDRAWYGMHPVSSKQIAQFKTHHERIVVLVHSAA
jgi:hypothetical protein